MRVYSVRRCVAGQRTGQRLLQETRQPGRQRGGILGLFVSIQFLI
jgi:hypothetical protein